MKKHICIFIFLSMLLLNCSDNNKQITKNLDSSIDTKMPNNDISIVKDVKTIYLLKSENLTDKDIELLANYECDFGYSRKTEKLINYGVSSSVYFTYQKLPNCNDEELYINFLTQDWCQSSKYELRSFKLKGNDTLITAFVLKKDIPNPYFVCISRDLTDNNNSNKKGYYINVFFENHGNSASYIEEITPQYELIDKIMCSVHDYESFMELWNKFY